MVCTNSTRLVHPWIAADFTFFYVVLEVCQVSWLVIYIGGLWSFLKPQACDGGKTHFAAVGNQQRGRRALGPCPGEGMFAWAGGSVPRRPGGVAGHGLYVR